MKKLIQRFKEWRERRYWKARHLHHIRTNVLTDLRWLSVDPVANEIMERYQWITSELFWYSTPVEPIDQFRRRIGLDPHQKKPINGLTAESAEQREAVRFCPECGHIGEVPESCRDCCPDGSHAKYVHPVIADMAQGGFHAMLNSMTVPPTPPAGVPDGFPLVKLGFGKVEVASGNHEGVPALIFGKNGTGIIWEATQPDRTHAEGETLACVTFTNIESLEVVQHHINEVRAMLSAALQPAAQMQKEDQS